MEKPRQEDFKIQNSPAVKSPPYSPMNASASPKRKIVKSSIGDIRFINNGSRILLDQPKLYLKKSRKGSLVHSSYN